MVTDIGDADITAKGKEVVPISHLWDEGGAQIWNEVMDEMWSFDPNEAASDGYSFDFLDPDQGTADEDPDEELPEIDLIRHNIFPCD